MATTLRRLSFQWNYNNLLSALLLWFVTGIGKPLARGLVERGLCKVLCQDQLYHIGTQPSLNGLFSVGKDEVKNQVPVSRLIMNLKPWNSISHGLSAEVGTLPAITQMGALYLHDNDVLALPHPDSGCFFYLFRVPEAWSRFMGFGRENTSEYDSTRGWR